MTDRAQFERVERTVSRSGFGLGVGAFLGFLFGGGIGAGVGALAGVALAAASTPDAEKGVLTSERKKLFDAVMASEEDPSKLDELARAFESEELPAHAELLRQRAATRRLSPEERDGRMRRFVQGLCSIKVESICHLADAFRREGALVSYKALLRHVSELEDLEAGKSSDIKGWEQKVDLACEVFGPGSKELAAAEANLSRVRLVSG